jgi:putative transposase
VFRVREDGHVKTKAIYTVYGINAEGGRDILDIHIGQGDGEGAKEWGRLLEKLRDRGFEDVLFFAVDGLEGFSEAIWEVFPNSLVQRCIVHMIRTSLRFVDDKDAKAIAKDLGLVYRADDETAALHALEQFATKWDGKYPEISKKWEKNWFELSPFFKYNAAIRRLIYTTNAVEGLYRHMRKVTKTKGAFTNDKALLKLLYLNLIHNPKAWKRTVFGWSEIYRGLVREFGDRFTKHVQRETIIS